MLLDSTVFYDLIKLVVHRNDEQVVRIVNSITNLYRTNIQTIDQNDIKYCELFISSIQELLNNKLNIEKNKIDILNLFKRQVTNSIYLKKDAYVKEAFADIISNAKDLTNNDLLVIISRMNNISTWFLCQSNINKMFYHLKESETALTQDKRESDLLQIKSILSEFRDAISTSSILDKDGPIERIDMSDHASIKAACGLYKERKKRGVIPTGLQGLNQMCGPDSKAFTLGESVIFAARTHNFKSGMLNKIPRWTAKYCKIKPPPGKLPMILFISLENEAFQNLLALFKDIYIDLYKCIPPNDVSEEEIVTTVYDYFDKAGITLVIERYLPDSFCYQDYVQIHEKYIDAGFEIIATVVDYLAQMSKTRNNTNTVSGDHSLFIALYRNVCNYSKAIGNTFFTGHQLSKEADNLVSLGIKYRVKRFMTKMFADSIGIAREVDFIIFQEIEKDELGNSWLTLQWAKHRYVSNTPEAHKFCAYKFDPELDIIDDVDTEFQGSRNFHSRTATATTEDIDAILG